MQWTGHHGEERHGGDQGSGGCSGQDIMVRRDVEPGVGIGYGQGCSGQGVVVRRDMAVAEVREEVAKVLLLIMEEVSNISIWQMRI